MAVYTAFDRAKFESFLDLLIEDYGVGHDKNELGSRWRDATGKLRENGKNVWEHVYIIPTKNPSVSIVIYSSISYTENGNGTTRDEGQDAVRVDVMCKSEEKGIQNKKIKRHYRTQGLFDNLKQTILYLDNQALEFKKWWDIKKMALE